MDQNKQQIVDRIKQATNILVTVSANPSVDQLAACIGLTLFLNKLDKHATAVFSGAVPSTIEFLKPESTLEQDTNSLRDFIIALDKAKADHLRYKVEENVVKIFITPYRTSISAEDLNFSQGDFNVEVVVALGVHEREDLDQAISSHGRILHDATVVSINVGSAGGLGAINWNDPAASSLSEMVTDLAEVIKPGSFDGQISTAFLTGIVAETERFSNARTLPATMNMAAKLMAAGANQQLIATSLSAPVEVAAPVVTPLEEDSAVVPEEPKDEDGTLSIDHSPTEQTEAPLDYSVHDDIEPVPAAPQLDIHIDEDGNFKKLGSEEPEPDSVVEETAEQDSASQPSVVPSRDYLTTSPSQDAEQAPISDVAETEPMPHIDSILTHDVGNDSMPEYIEEPVPVLPQVAAEEPEEVPLPPVVEPPAPPMPAALPSLSDILPSSADEPLPASTNIPTPNQPEEPVGAHQEVSPPAPAPEVPVVGGDALDEARSAVMNAVGSGDTSLEPVASLGAQPLGESLHEEAQPPANATPIADILAQIESTPPGSSTGEVVNPVSPPTVPPPILPPLPGMSPQGNSGQNPESPPQNAGNPLFNFPTQ